MKKVLERAWQKLSAGLGTQGRRFYDWAVIVLANAVTHQIRARKRREAVRACAHEAR
ncbi:hypothetical protein AB0I77_17950 [Streptomyces sp. NPDC050619]|uniref:hypothetical protein n=1 Tax=Streptomyces sp. NPDC050619 TaxID=3157214 RepID=UPI003429BEC7